MTLDATRQQISNRKLLPFYIFDLLQVLALLLLQRTNGFAAVALLRPLWTASSGVTTTVIDTVSENNGYLEHNFSDKENIFCTFSNLK